MMVLFFLINVFIALKGTRILIFICLHCSWCGGSKTSPRTSIIVQFIFYFLVL